MGQRRGMDGPGMGRKLGKHLARIPALPPLVQWSSGPGPGPVSVTVSIPVWNAGGCSFTIQVQLLDGECTNAFGPTRLGLIRSRPLQSTLTW